MPAEVQEILLTSLILESLSHMQHFFNLSGFNLLPKKKNLRSIYISFGSEMYDFFLILKPFALLLFCFCIFTSFHKRNFLAAR